MSHFVLFEEERQQHQHPSVVDDPPYVDVAVRKAFVVARVEGHIFWDHQSQMGGRSAADGVLVEKQYSLESFSTVRYEGLMKI